MRGDSSRPKGLLGVIGSGVGMAAEYREHRKQQKLSRENSRQGNEVSTTGSATLNTPSQPASRRAFSSDLPSAREDTASQQTGRSLASGGPALDDKKSTAAYSESESDAESDDFDLETLDDDEEDWALDDIVPDPPSYEESQNELGSADELVQDVLHANESGVERARLIEPLPFPVIIPQRRPGEKGRGFVRAYAPVLANNGIDEKTFLKFLKNFHQSSKASPIFDVIQVSAAIAGLAPSVIAMAVSISVQVATRAGQEVQSRERNNKFLDRMNEVLFKPAGLYAMVVKYKQDADINQTSRIEQLGAQFGIASKRVNLRTSDIIAKYDRTLSTNSSSSSSRRNMTDRMRDIRLASDTTRGAVELPEAATLIFPDIDRAFAANGINNETAKEKLKDFGKFLQDYRDRRAQNEYATNNPTSGLAIPEDQRAFRSKLANSNHAMYSNGLIGLVSGGAVVTPSQIRHERRVRKVLDKSKRRVMNYERKISAGEELSTKKQGRYERHMMVLESRFGGGGGGGRGLINTLIGASTGAIADRGKVPIRGDHEEDYRPQREYGASSSRALGSYGSGVPAAPYSGRRGGAGSMGTVRRLMKEDVLYLMIVNMPSEAELAEARALLDVR